jgi:hypothetical protein
MGSHGVPSGSFSSREFNGEVLLGELIDLKDASLQQTQLDDLALAVEQLEGSTVSQAASALKQLAVGRYCEMPAVAKLLVHWASRLKLPADVSQLIGHFHRLALTFAIVGAVRRCAPSLKGSR